ncbi:TfuA-like protein [Bradyrhizobium sp.]|uniref:TfuA-like protein n=1 Tax=Bradyrhizobium sp. TaxID=376 RepID=UPI000B17F19B|nr:TfuA-like protein [Bradyrhizobium sp.]
MISDVLISTETRAPTKTIVFSGPSIAAAGIRRLAAATHAPPIKRGDLAAVDDYDIVVILDGEFGQNRSVSPKEILAVLERGKTVIGASSMGALRASELDRCGMIGVGWVYDHFRQCAIRRDADVALVYSPFDFKPMTVPIVDVEYWMEQASAAGLIPDRERTLALKAARKIFFAERTADGLLASLRRILGSRMLESLLAFSGGTIPSVKSADAVEAVRLSACLAGHGGSIDDETAR